MVKFHHSEFEKFEYNINPISQQIFKSWPYFGAIFSALKEFLSHETAIIMLADSTVSPTSLINDTDHLAIFMTSLNEALEYLTDLDDKNICFVDADKICISDLVHIMPKIKKIQYNHVVILLSKDNFRMSHIRMPSNIADGCICLRNGPRIASVEFESAVEVSMARLDEKSHYSTIA